ncbi:MAG: chorismate synthase [Bacteroidales bacterium]|nr:chorismate synthase [Candidatus Egerieousia equi]
MKNSIGTSVILTVFGESHGPQIGAVLDGMAPGIQVDEKFIAQQLNKRRPCGTGESARVEEDEFQIVSGVFNGRTTGAPICILIPNKDVRSEDYEKNLGLARPSHADFVAHVKYYGFEDWRGGGHFSGRITAGIVAIGAIALSALKSRGINIGTHILKCAGVSDIPFGCGIEKEVLASSVTDGQKAQLPESKEKSAGTGNSVAAESEYDYCKIVSEQLEALENRPFPVLDNVAQEMQEKILAAKNSGDSVGGVVQAAVTGLPAGVGEPWFDSLEGALSKAMFAIGGVKGVEFGSGFAMADMLGSQANDSLYYTVGDMNSGADSSTVSNAMEQFSSEVNNEHIRQETFSSDEVKNLASDHGKLHELQAMVRTRSNNNGGINGGISNGMPLVFNLAVKPTPSIAVPQETVNMITGENATLKIVGRHDPAIVRRICPVVTAMTAIVLCDMLALAFGTNWLATKVPGK